QSALLAPTEVLAAQHFRSITEALRAESASTEALRAESASTEALRAEPASTEHSADDAPGHDLLDRVRPVLLTSKMPVAERRRALLEIASGSARIVVGTHALLSEGVSFYDLGLIVVDEQHRFGVEQREALRLKGAEPHVLAMTATPIPRTVALTAFGDLETSVIRELPAGRRGIETFAVPVLEKPAWAERAWRRATEEVAAGRQVYVVCPAIADNTREEGDEDPA
ncbi:DEAD/DEAH box helicase, partial [Leucobacter soli]